MAMPAGDSVMRSLCPTPPTNLLRSISFSRRPRHPARTSRTNVPRTTRHAGSRTPKDGETAPSGFRFVTVPGNPRAYYAFLQSQGKVRRLVLALDRQDCVN
ncbi:hypothetical protein GCM10020001_100770 [Nonomuraea salmonea]